MAMINKAETHDPQLENVSETLLVPLFFRAKETLERGIISDYKAVEIVDRIDYNFQKMASDHITQTIIAVRTKMLDRIVDRYIKSTPNPVIINLGAGLDTRHIRFGHVKWYQLDLEQPILLRSLFFPGHEQKIVKSIFDFSWINDVEEKEDVLIIAEGILMYFTEQQVRRLFQQIGVNFSNSRVVFDTIPESYVRLYEHKSIDLRHAPFQWGNNRTSKIEKWNYGLKCVKNHYYLSGNWSRWRLLLRFALIPSVYTGFKLTLMKIN
jgi:O-methyltransferase involved in polyketide biosynthesis